MNELLEWLYEFYRERKFADVNMPVRLQLAISKLEGMYRMYGDPASPDAGKAAYAQRFFCRAMDRPTYPVWSNPQTQAQQFIYELRDLAVKVSRTNKIPAEALVLPLVKLLQQNYETLLCQVCERHVIALMAEQAKLAEEDAKRLEKEAFVAETLARLRPENPVLAKGEYVGGDGCIYNEYLESLAEQAFSGD